MFSTKKLCNLIQTTARCQLGRRTTRCFLGSGQQKNSPRPEKNYLTIITTCVSSVILGTVAYFTYRKISRESRNGSASVEYHKDKFCSGSSGKLVKVASFWLPEEFFKERGKLKKIREFKIRNDDIIVASFPKSGTTWVQEIVSHVISDDDGPDSRSNVEERFPYVEYVYPGLAALEAVVGPRCLKTHLPLELLPQDAHHGRGKVIYIIRNPKDVAVSYWHFVRDMSVVRYSGTITDFCHSFLQGSVPYGPWSEHVLQFWEKRDSPNLLLLTYEDLHQSPCDSVRKIAAFLGRELSDERITEIVRSCSFSRMRENDSANYSWWQQLGLWRNQEAQFLRKGCVGDWKNYIPDAISHEFEKTCLCPVKERGLHLIDSTPP